MIFNWIYWHLLLGLRKSKKIRLNTLLIHWMLHVAVSIAMSICCFMVNFTSLQLFLDNPIMWPETAAAPSLPWPPKFMISVPRSINSPKINSTNALPENSKSQYKKSKNYFLITKSQWRHIYYLEITAPD